MRVLIVEDEQELSKQIHDFLHGESMVVDMATSISQASELLAVNPYDFILLDLGLPDGDGMDLFEDIHEYQESPITIILTARADIDDRIKGLEKGADDYLPKPFSLLELKARMHAIIRRKSGWNTEIIEIGSFKLDLQAKTVWYGEHSINLTSKEFNLLQFMILNKNRVLTRFQLAEHLWGDHLDDENQSNFIDVHIKNIRKKLSHFEETPWLETVRGVGYKVKL
jgi:DNA-binding response OmpR family regulator